MKILYIVSGLNSFGGIETFCRNIMSGIDFEHYHIDFLVTSNEQTGETEDNFIAKGSTIYHLDGNKKLIERIIDKRNFFKSLNGKYDIIHIHTVLTTAFYFAKLSKKYTNAKVIIHSHTASNYEGTKLKNDLCRPLLNRYADYKLACSQNAGEFLFGKKKCKNLKIIFNAVNIPNFVLNLADRIRIRQDLCLNDGDFVLLIVGRLTPAKNHPFLLKVFSELVKTNPNSKLLICGDGDERGNIETIIKNYNLVGKVIMLGNRTDVGAIMSASDCFVLPSLYEGLPTVLIEAQVNGLPVLCSDRVTDEVIIDKRVIQLDIVDHLMWFNELLKIAGNFKHEIDANCFNKINEVFGLVSINKEIQKYYSKINNKHEKN